MARGTKIFLPTKGAVTLTDADHVATGGEGSVYCKNGMAIKLFLDPQGARSRGMAEKIQLLAQLKHPFIVAPQSPVYDAQQQLIGYAMPMAKGVPLMKTFANSWRDQNAFTTVESAKLVDNMRLAVQQAHTLGALLVDANEFNYLADGTTPQLIDVDSWQIGRFKGTALMPSIRDYHSAEFSEGTDWFSWAVVTFQVFCGIHPYKGTHPDFKKGDLEGRMRANASVFDTRVRLNSAVRDLAQIPSGLRAWYEGVFQSGDRSLPPNVFAPAIAPGATRQVKVITHGNGQVRHEKLIALPAEIKHVSGNGVAFYRLNSQWQAFDLQRKAPLSTLTPTQIEALFCNQAALVRHEAHFVLIELGPQYLTGRVLACDPDPRPTTTDLGRLPCLAEKLVVIGNRVFALNPGNENGLTELALDTLGARTLLSVKTVWPVLVQSTRFFDGFALMDALGTPFLVIPQDASVVVGRAPALREFRVVEGFSRHPSYVVLRARSRQDDLLYRLTLRLRGTHFEILDQSLADTAELNIAVNAKGILVELPEDGQLRVANTLASGAREVQDPSLRQEMRLFALPEGIHYYHGAHVYRLSLQSV